jgi:S1-C subfamily serine protease
MTLADRPYGSFPRDASPHAEAPPVAPRPRRFYEPAPGRRAALIRRGAFFASLFLFACAVLLSPPALRRTDEIVLPTPEPTLAAPDVYARVGQAVVEIRARSANGEERIGSGVVVDRSGAILTSLHVVQDASLTIRFADGSEARGGLASALVEQDIAVVLPSQLPATLEPAVLGDPRRLRIGDSAYVIGSPFGLTRSFSAGVVSGLDRQVRIPPVATDLTGLIQVDAAINPGNSGGPVVDSRGEVVGIVVGVPRPGDGTTAVGVGFAVTIDNAAGALGVPPD